MPATRHLRDPTANQIGVSHVFNLERFVLLNYVVVRRVELLQCFQDLKVIVIKVISDKRGYMNWNEGFTELGELADVYD